MSSQGSKGKRPESFDDLADYEKRQILVSIRLTEAALLGGRVLAAAEDVIGAFRRAYPPEELTVQCEGRDLEVVRKLGEPELSARLKSAQESWDYRNARSSEDGA